MSLSSLSILRLPSSSSDSSLCFLSRFIKEIILINLSSILACILINSPLMEYIQNLPTYLEELAYASIFDVNISNKFAAEQQLTTYFFRLSINDYPALFEEASENVLLAFSAILLKNIAILGDHLREVALMMNQIIMKWYQTSGIFQRSSGNVVKKYVENTFGQFMGNCLKMLYQRDETKKWVEQFLQSLSSMPHYRLFLYYRFIESITSIDESIGYINYRTLLTSFQDNFIPKIFEALVPYFMSISDLMDINELTFLQGTMTVAQRNSTACFLQFSNKNNFTEMIFKLFDEVIGFRYNISPKEYSDLSDYEKVKISFPEELLIKIIKFKFLDALYNVLMQLMRTNEFQYQQIGLNCLKKLLLAKLTYLKQDMQTTFTLINLQGVLGLLQMIINKGQICHRQSAVHILECNINFIGAFGLDQLEARIKKKPQKKQLFDKWLQLTRSIPMYLLQNDDQIMDSQNNLFLTASEMLQQLTSEFRLNNFLNQREIIAQFYSNYTQTFLTIFFGKPSSLLGSKPFSFDQLKKSSTEVFGNIKMMMTHNYQQTFNNLNVYCEHILGSSKGQVCSGNFLLLIRELIYQPCFLEESVYGRGLVSSRNYEVDSYGTELNILTEIIGKIIHFTTLYQHESKMQGEYLNNSIVLFFSSLLNRFVKVITASEEEDSPAPPFIDDELFRRMKTQLSIDDETFLLHCLCVIAKFIKCCNTRNIDFIFQAMLENILIMKWSMKKEYFRTTKIYLQMVKLFKQLSQFSVSAQFVKWRVLLFKIITILTFDDATDQYRLNIRSTINLLKTTAIKANWAEMLYGLTGIFQIIEGNLIFRFFLRHFIHQISFPDLLRQLFNLGFQNPTKYLKDVMHLSAILISNKSNRLDHCQIVQTVYEIIGMMLPYWNQYMEFQMAADQEDILTEIYQVFIVIVKDGKINICLLDKIQPNAYKKFVKLVMISISFSLQTIESSIEFSKNLFSVCQLVTQSIIKQLFMMDDPEMVQNINFLITKLMIKLSSNFQTIASGTFQETLLEPILQTIDKFYAFIRKNRSIKHLPLLASNISKILSDQLQKQNFLQTIIKIAMQFRHHFTNTLENISNICVNLIDFYQIDDQKLIEHLGLGDNKDKRELERIILHIREQKQDFVWLTLQMKDWLKERSRFTQIDIDQY